MLRSSKTWLSVLLVLGLSRDCQGLKPVMSPAKPEIYIDEGHSLELTCTSAKTMKFYYPKDLGNTIKTSPTSLKEQSLSDEQKITFRRSKTVPGDTGWYGCADHDIDVTPGIYDQPAVSWTYVYVKSKTSRFVQLDVLQPVREIIGGNVTFPCRPTSPHYKVRLMTKVKVRDDVSYDPRFGFKLINITLEDTGYFWCSIRDPEPHQQITFHLFVIQKQVLSEPKIIEDTLKHVTRGQTLHVNCTTDVDANIEHVMNWTTPQRNGRITTRLYKETIGLNKQKTTCELTINGVTNEDKGDYECTITTSLATKKTNTYIKVYDPDVKYIRLTPSDSHWYNVRNYGDHVQWVVHVDAYPQAKLKWLNPRGDEITGSRTDAKGPKYVVSITSSSAILRINRLTFKDSGVYSLQATNEYKMETLSFGLEIEAQPQLFITIQQAFYFPEQAIELTCYNPEIPWPNVTWTFLKAPNYPSFEGSEMVKLQNYSIDSTTNAVLYNEITMKSEMSGQVTCARCNAVSCDSTTELILISDVLDGFGIIETNNQVMPGDNVEIICAASLYNYTGVEWSTNMDHGIVETDPVAPFITETNMNKTAIAIDLSTEGHKPMVLKCHVHGMPKPNVTWYKDDTRISSNEQYEYRHDNQELYIKYLLEENSGTYTCKVDNRLGKVENSQIIEIKVKEVSKALIVSIVVLLLICAIFIIYFSIKMHREKVMRKLLLEAGLTHFEEGAVECLNPNLTVDDQAELLPYDKKWEFPRDRLKLGKQLGFGAFGVVMKADALGICKDEAVSTVAVKMVRKSTEFTYIRALASELKIMVHLGKHLNVVNLLGACTKNIMKHELLVIVEYCCFGNLRDYLLRHRTDFINQIDPATGKLDPSIGLDTLMKTTSVESNRIKCAAVSFSRSLSANSSNGNSGVELVSYTTGTDSQGISISSDGCVFSNNSTLPEWRTTYRGDHKDQNLKPICTQDFLSWGFQVARGMEYLSQRKVLHGDLAARNILLAENNVVKICDFGLAKTLYKDYNYKKKGDAPLPIKWMAIESIKNRVFSTQSDIWSFGIVLWEFFTLAKTPYPSMDPEKQYQRLIEGYRMEQPKYATDEIYDIMLQCWKAKPALRPTFTNLVSSIGDLLEKCVKEYYVEMNNPYMDMNNIVLQNGKNDYLTMMSAPDHDAQVSPNNDYVHSPRLARAIPQDNSYVPMSPSFPGRDSGTFSPRITSNCCKSNFPTSDGKSNVHWDSESEAVELSPMLNH